MDINKLKNQIKNKNKNGNMTKFDGLISIFLGVEPKEFFPKIKDKEGHPVKDEKGEVMREPVATGFTYTFSELGTSKIIKIVVRKKLQIELLDLVILGGYGYDIKQNSMIFIQEEGVIRRYDQKNE